ncbi:MAG: TIR domain-containing protein [Pirellula sp.]
MNLRPSVFIGSSSEGLAVARAIQVNLDYACEVVIWSQGVFGLGGGTLDALVAALDTFDFAVLTVTPDDMTESRDREQNSPRDNVLLELGMFIGGIGRDRTFFVYDRTADLKLPSDLAGVTAATYQPHKDGNLQASLGAAATQIQNAINAAGRRKRFRESDAIHKDTQFQIIHDLINDASEQYIILMYEKNLKLPRRRNVFAPTIRYEFWKANQTGGIGGFSVDDLCKKLPDADLLSVDLRDQVSLTARGAEYAKWLIDRGHKATFFKCEYGAWGERPPEMTSGIPWTQAPNQAKTEEPR